MRTPFWQEFCLLPGPTPWEPTAQTEYRVAQICLAEGPAYSELPGFTGARTQTCMADLTIGNMHQVPPS
eukprot:1161486-Pelagomonas_calceolata.AAC.16